MRRTAKRFHKTITRDITVTNISPNRINCCVYEQLPLSKDGKIKVLMTKPDLKRPGGTNYQINSFNNLEARSAINPSAKFDMKFEYTMEWPEGDELEIIQKRK